MSWASGYGWKNGTMKAADIIESELHLAEEDGVHVLRKG